MEAPALEPAVLEELRSIRPGYELRWNPKGRCVKPGGYTVLGERIDPVWEGRWELWDENDIIGEHRVLVVQDPATMGYRAPDMRLVTHLRKQYRLLEAAARKGDPAAVLDAIMQLEEERQELIPEQEMDAYLDAVAHDVGEYLGTLKSPVTADLTP